MMKINIFELAGAFAENKDVARKIRIDHLEPALAASEDIILNFEQVSGTTQSFVHALISELFRKFGNSVLDHIEFKNCNETVKKIITLVADYMQEAE